MASYKSALKLLPIHAIFSTSDDWQPPPFGFIKMNSDGAFDDSSQNDAYSWVATDHDRIILCISADSIQNVPSPINAEAIALSKAMDYALSQGWRKVIFETDCASLVDVVNFLHMHQVDDPTLQRCISLLSSFDEWFLSLVKRDADSVADMLAKRAKSCSWSWLSFDALPFGLL